MSTPGQALARPAPSTRTVKLGGYSVEIPGGQAMAVPLLMIVMLAMLLLPLPPFLLDILFTFNIALSLVVMIVAAYSVKPLDCRSTSPRRARCCCTAIPEPTPQAR
jgi:hypothetical protein